MAKCKHELRLEDEYQDLDFFERVWKCSECCQVIVENFILEGFYDEKGNPVPRAEFDTSNFIDD